ncbi:MAG: heme lyase CcmF/NrfE family subunit [Aquisalimonadaceae bacterium]
MIPELGNFALVLALGLALIQSGFCLAGAAMRRTDWMAVGTPATWGMLGCAALAYACLTYSFVANDFSVLFVAEHSNSGLPLFYRVAGVWGGHEGSLLLWILLLAGWTLAVAAWSGSLPLVYRARVLGILGLVSVGFLAFTILTSNPFDRLFPVPADGQDLNPLLQDPGMVIHPPMLYVGYVGMSVVFALSIAALMGGRLDAAWARWSRPWTLVAWLFLALGIALGSWWAYKELGWGGWWFWDPVENASLMPWLVATALIHSLAATEKRGTFKAWTVLLAIAGFSLSLLGTFLVRSGALTSVHAFANDPARGIFLLGFMVIVVGGSLALYTMRARQIRSDVTFALFSRETLLLANNVLLMVACAAVLIGTLYPLLLDAFGMGRISIGPPYFNAIIAPLALFLAALMGLGPLTAWRQADAVALARRLRFAALGSVALAAVVVVLLSDTARLIVIVTVALALWIVLTSVMGIHGRVRLRQGSLLQGLRGIPRGFYGMHLAHVGFAVSMLGIGVVTTHEVETFHRLSPGETVETAGYTWRFDGVSNVQGPNYSAVEGRVVVSRGDSPVTVLRPQKRHYPVRDEIMTQAGINAGFGRDLFATLGERVGEDGAWVVRLHYKPLVRWIWLGAIFMAVGGALAASDRRYRLELRQRAHADIPSNAAAAGGGA